MKAFLPPVNISPGEYEALVQAGRQCLEGCRAVAGDGTVVFRPDGSGHYDAMWTRDFCYMVEGLGQWMEPAEVLAAADYLLDGQREDGVIPDRRQCDGTSVYLAGPPDRPLGTQPPADNGPFMVKILAAYSRLTGDHRGFLERREALYRAMESVPVSEDWLVFIDPNRPHPGYGFTDCVAKTGNDFFCSVLHWEACQALAKALSRAEEHDEAHDWYERAEHCSRHLGDLWSDEVGMFWAASEGCRQVDLWGSVYACVVRVATKSQARRVAEYLLEHWDACIFRGHLRHLPGGEYWEQLLTDVPPDSYQNGGFWAVPSGWLAQTLALADPAAARRLISELVAEFTGHGVHEWITPEGRHVPGYVAAIANVLRAVQPSKKLA